MKSIRVLHVIAGMDPKMGGVCQAVRLIIAGLADFEVESEVASLDSPDSNYLSLDTFKIHALGPGKSPWRYNKKFIPWLNNNLYRFDAIILHGLWLYNGYAIKKAFDIFKRNNKSSEFKNNKSPGFFVMPHGMLDPYFQRDSKRKLKAVRNWLYWKLIENKVVNQSDGLLFTSEQERLLAKETFIPYNPKKEILIGLGTEEPPTYSANMQIAFLEKSKMTGDDPYMLFLSRIHEKKGVDLLIQAYKELSKDADMAKLVIAGPNLDSGYGQMIQKMVLEDPSINNKIHFTGMLNGDTKWGAFYGCEVFVLPSHQENFGIVVAEAMACSKAVLISNKVNINAEILNCNGGIIAEDTLEGTKNILMRWANLDDKQKKDMHLNARNCFTKNFSMGTATKKLLDAICMQY